MLHPRHWAIPALLLALGLAGCVTPLTQAPTAPAGIGEAIAEGPASYRITKRPLKPTATPTPVATPTPTPTATTSTTTSKYTPTLTDTQWAIARQVLTLTNQRRAAVGAKALALDTRLMGVATYRSQDMATRNYFSHYDPEGHSPFWHLTQAGISYSYAAENIAWGYSTADLVMTAWMNSTGHRANILNPNLGKLGVGYVKNSAGTPYWTQLFTN